MPYLHKYRIFPLLVYLSFVEIFGFWFWLGLIILVALCAIKNEHNFFFLPAILIVLLPSLYMGAITWNHSLAVIMSFSLTFKLVRFNDTSALYFSLLWLAMLSFFAGPLAPLVILAAILIYLPRKAILPSALIFIILLALPLGRTDWKTWLGQTSTSIQRSWEFDHEFPVQEEPAQDTAIQPQPAEYPWTDILNQIFFILLFFMYAVILFFLVRLFWQMRFNKKKILQGFLTLFLLLLGGSLLIPIHRWLGTIASFSDVRDTTGPSPLLPDHPSVQPLPGDEGIVPPPEPPVQDPALPPAQASADYPLFDLIAQITSILLVVVIIVLAVWFIRRYWVFPLQAKDDQPAVMPPQKTRQQKEKTINWDALSSSELIEKAYETLRKQRFSAQKHKTPLELKKSIHHPAFHRLTDAYVHLIYQLKPPQISDENLRLWIRDCFTEI